MAPARFLCSHASCRAGRDLANQATISERKLWQAERPILSL
jgi:hypothetical protein